MNPGLLQFQKKVAKKISLHGAFGAAKWDIAGLKEAASASTTDDSWEPSIPEPTV